MKFLSDILAKAGLTVDGVVTLNNTATGQTPDANDNSTKLATTAWVRTFVQPYSLPIASASTLGGIKVGAGLSINPTTGVLTASSGISTRDVCIFIATAGQTTFSCSYTVDQVDVFYNGSKLGSSEFTATNGTTVVFNTACKVNDYVEIVSWVAGAGLSTSRTITIDGVTQDLTANRTWNILPTGGAAGDILAKVSGTNYDVTWIPNYTSTVQHTVKAAVAVTKGQAVYISSADGTNMIVSKASNASEGTSSKTLGLVAQDLAINGQGFVVTEGLLAGLDTSTATAGDPVWLGTNGNLIFGLLNKPTAPAHLVFIGVVTRVQQNNGEIFVKVQNGFEMSELHDYVQSGVQDNFVISYESSTSLYKPKSIATLLGYTPANAARSLTINGTSYDLTADRTWTLTTSNITEGTNLYYTDTRVGTYLTANSYATQSYVSTQIANLVDSAPTTLDTLNELAAALGDDPNFATTVSTSIGTKVPQTRTITINGTAYDLSADRSWSIAAGVTSFNTRTGAITLTSGDVTGALGYTPYNSTNPNGYISSYTETDTLAAVTGRGATTSTALTLSGRVTFSSTLADRPQFPGGILGLDTGDGNFDIWGISRDYYPSHATAANAWGLRWNGDNNDFEFVGGGTSRVILDMDGGNITATGTLSASGYNKTNWDTAYSWGNHSGVYLPLAGGTMAGDITLAGYRVKDLTSTNRGIFIGNWGGAGYWGLGSTSNAHELKLDQVSSSTGFWEGATDVNLYLGSNRLVLHTANISSYALPLSGGTMSGTPVFTAAWSNAAGDYTGITNPAYKVDVTSGYWRVVYKGAHASVSGVYNYETGKNVYWGEPTDTGDYIFRGRTMKWAASNGTEYTVWNSSNLTNLNQLSNGPGYLTSVAWTGISSGIRENYNLGFRPADNSSSYAGFSFGSPGNDANAGYFLVRGGADNDVYTQNGLTIVADLGWLTLAQRTTASKGVRIMTGSSASVTRVSVTDSSTTINNVLNIASLASNDGQIENSTGQYFHLGGWGVARTHATAILVNTAYWADNAGTADNSNAVGGVSLSNLTRKDTNSQFLRPYYEYGNYLTSEAPSTLVSQMNSSGGVRVDFAGASYTAHGDWGHILTFSGYNRYSMSQIQTNYYTTDARLYYRQTSLHSDSWLGWKEFVFTSGNTPGIMMSGPIRRASHSSGFFEGSYNNIGGNSANSNPIYTIGSAYNPSDSSLGVMYGIGYAHPNFWGGGKTTSWGMYCANGGVINVTLGEGSTSIWAQNDIVAYSDIRVKDNIEVIDNALEKVQKIRGVTFTRKDATPEDSHKRHAGVIAQEVLTVLPEVVSGTEQDMYSVAYGNMAGLFIEAIKELKAENDALKEILKRNNII